jgi:hypothetical protein
MTQTAAASPSPVLHPSLASIAAALRYLDGECDGASRRDDVGFNGSDSFKGKRFARLLREGRNFIREMWEEALALLGKYQETQLRPAAAAAATGRLWRSLTAPRTAVNISAVWEPCASSFARAAASSSRS